MYDKLKAILPEVEAAEEQFYAELEHVDSDREYKEAVAKFNGVLEQAIEALWEDTQTVNSKSTLQQVYRARSETNTHFGVAPSNVIRHILAKDHESHAA